MLPDFTRRDALAMAIALGLPGAGVSAQANATPFSPDEIDRLAREAADKPYVPPARVLGGPFEMDYNQFRALRFRRERAVWSDSGLPFQIELFHAGYLYRDTVEISLVENGSARRLDYNPSLFRFDPPLQAPPADFAGAYAGFRVLADVHKPTVLDEFLVFLGASYFRGLARGQDYGLSARGLAIDTARSTPEEFPLFRAFWLERPRQAVPGSAPQALTLHALMDSPSVAGAFTFIVTPYGKTTMVEVDARFYARRVIDNFGIAPLTSMYFFGPAGHTKHDDFRERVHDSEGLALLTSSGERIWRPIINATTLQYSAFEDAGPRGFGLIQRNRDVAAYQDLVVRSDIRPSGWVEPLGDWGKGAVVLHELPTVNEYMDNIVAYWQPAEALTPGVPRRFRYRLHWCDDVPGIAGEGRILQVRSGQFIQPPTDRLVTVDFIGADLCTDCSGAPPTVHIETMAPSAIGSHAVGDNPINGGVRVALQFKPQEANSNDVRVWFERDGKRITETCVYRWVKV